MVHLRRALRAPLLLLAFLWVVFEETIWRWAGWLGAAVARLPIFVRFEQLLLRLDPHVVLVLFLMPLLGLIPLKLAAVWLIGGGHAIKGAMLLVGAKMLGTVVSARLYAVAEPKLMQIPLFVRVRAVVLALVARAHAFLDASPSWQAARRATRRAKEMVRALVLGGEGGMLERVRAVRARWRHRA